MRLSLLVVALTLVTATSAAAETRIPLKPLPNVSVGRVDGTQAFIALSVEGGKLRVYVCDGTLRRDPTVSAWFRGRADARELRAGGHTLTIDPGGKTGSFDGHAFTLRPATSPSGLFQGRRDGTEATWIVLQGMQKRGTFIPTRPPKCRFVLVTGPNGTQQWVNVCG
jgi:hypothetical protein